MKTQSLLTAILNTTIYLCQPRIAQGMTTNVTFWTVTVAFLTTVNMSIMNTVVYLYSASHLMTATPHQEGHLSRSHAAQAEQMHVQRAYQWICLADGILICILLNLVINSISLLVVVFLPHSNAVYVFVLCGFSLYMFNLAHHFLHQ